ncbi:aminotransferase class III-fold pyridoxal phosphate-dependent enzyme [Candidatus Nitrospira bockiana]
MTRSADPLIPSVPVFSVDDAHTFARDLFGVSAVARPLPSERDQNFLLETKAGPEFVLKIANGAELREVLEAQNAALAHLAVTAPALACPRPCPSLSGQTILSVRGAHGATHFVRLLSYVPGHLLVETAPHPPELLQSLGSFFGRLDQALSSFAHPALRRDLLWDLARAAATVAEHLASIPDPSRRTLIQRFLDRFREQVVPALPTLRTSVIHNDGNDYNVLVTGIEGGGRVTGVVDFGDLIESCTVFEPAICAAYAILGKTDPVFSAAQVIAGYHAASPLLEDELAWLYDLIALRLCTSVTLSAFRKDRVPDNRYLTVSEAPAWAALDRLAGVSPRFFHYAMRDACGWPACPQTAAVIQWLEANAEQVEPVIGPDLRKGDHTVIDLSAGGADFAEIGDLTDIRRWTDAIFERMHAAGTQVGVGRYGEARRSYTAAAYRPAGTEVDGWRTVHLGIDLFLAPGAPVYAPLEGTVHSLADNAEPQDYGPTVILRHDLSGAGECFTLYGHLSPESLERLSPGQSIAKGAKIGTIGHPPGNGDWPPHVHFQLITDLLDQTGNFPGVCAPRDRRLWQSLCPDPNLILHIPGLPSPHGGRSPEAIVSARRRHLGANVSVSYARPLKIVRGWKQYLYDHLGREYLDGTNNVAHVGHGHPAVVRAAARQMALLNTNTRYLHDLLVDYAERLSATLPDPLRVCYFVCSGSEANELALRLARAHTRATDVLVVEGAYHGQTTSLIEISPYKFAGPGGAGAPAHVHTVPMPDVYRGPYKGPEAGRRYAAHVRAAVERVKRGNRRVAAFFCESLLSCAGQIVLPPGYLEEAYQHVRKAGGVCVADEIQVGFGRVGSRFWGFELQGVVPDIVTMGKPMGNGHPLGAVVTTPEIAASFANGMEYFNTFGGNPVSCAVGLAVLDVLENEGLQEQARTVGRYLKDELTGLMAKHALIGDVRGEGLFLGLEFVRHRDTQEPAGLEAAYIAERLRDLGVLTGIDGPLRNVLKIKPPLVFTTADADRLVSCLDRVLGEPRLMRLRTPS